MPAHLRQDAKKKLRRPFLPKQKEWENRGRENVRLSTALQLQCNSGNQDMIPQLVRGSHFAEPYIATGEFCSQSYFFFTKTTFFYLTSCPSSNWTSWTVHLLPNPSFFTFERWSSSSLFCCFSSHTQTHFQRERERVGKRTKLLPKWKRQSIIYSFVIQCSTLNCATVISATRLIAQYFGVPFWDFTS